MTDLRLSLVQTPLHWKDPAANRAMLSDILDGLQDATDVVVLPEMFNTGFNLEPAGCAEPAGGASVEWMCTQAQRLDAAVVGSLAVEDGGRHYNRLYWVTPDGAIAHSDKRHLFRMAGEHEHYTAGDTRLIVDWRGWRIFPLVCYDLRFPVWSRNTDDYQLLLYVANWPAARRSSWQRLLRARAIENLCFCAGVNRVGEDGNGIRYAGDSGVLDWLGDELLPFDGNPGVRHVNLDAAGLARYREKFPAHRDADGFQLD